MNTGLPGKSITRVGIVGSGRMGESIFYHLSDFDFSLVWLFRKDHLKDKAIATFDRKLRRMHRAGALDDETYAHKRAHTTITVDREELSNCDLIIETIVEDAEIKARLFTDLDSIVNTDCLFVSNSSSIKPSQICPASERREKFAGLHFFFPVRFNRFVELTGTEACSPDTMASLKQFAAHIGKEALVLPEEGAFILNKVFIYSQAQAFHTHREQFLTYRQIDQLIKEHLFTMGTFEFLDHVGLDVILSSAKNYIEDMDHKDFIRITIEEVQKFVDKGHLGVKSGRGFYSYSKDGTDTGTPDLKQISDEERKHYEADVVNKLMCLYINGAYSFVDKGYCSEADIDAALGEYKGMEKGPVTLATEIGFGRAHESLMHYYAELGEGVFYPAPSLRGRAGAANKPMEKPHAQ